MPNLDWSIDHNSIYLNHGSFGPPPDVVRNKQLELQSECNSQPMNFYLRRLEPLWFAARNRLADFLGCSADNLIFSENATASMNHVANFFPLKKGDEVLLNDHEYGVVKRIWERKCKEKEAIYREAKLPESIESASQVVEAMEQEVSDRTKLIVVSHITSPTAITLPIEPIISMAKSRGIAICIDGPHAPIQVPLNLDQLAPDFYVASCHKWLSAPLGTGFTYVAEPWQPLAAEPLLISWGRLRPAPIEHWSDHHIWCGTRDYSGYLSIPTAIDAFEELGIEQVRSRNHQLAQYARNCLTVALSTRPLVPDDPAWYSMMAAVWLPTGNHNTLQHRLWKNHHIEVPIVYFGDKYLVRVSCHLYNTMEQIDTLVNALRIELTNQG